MPRVFAALIGCLVCAAGLAGCSSDVPEWAVVAPADPDGVPLYDRSGERVGTWREADIVRLIPEGETQPGERVEVLGGWVNPEDVDFCPRAVPKLRETMDRRGTIEGLQLELDGNHVHLSFSLDLSLGDGFRGDYRCLEGEVWPVLVDRGCGW